MLVGLAFCGQVEASSIVTYEDHYVRDDLNIRKILLEMEINKSPSVRPTACFLTPCISIGSPLIQNESATFRQAFPSVKIFGFFGYGEIGTNLYEELESHDKDGARAMHYYSIALSVLRLL